MYKIKHGFCSENSDLFNMNNRHQPIRDANDFITPPARSVLYGNESVSYMCPIIWPLAPQEIRNSSSLEVF